jgi:hypothetical protein
MRKVCRSVAAILLLGSTSAVAAPKSGGASGAASSSGGVCTVSWSTVDDFLPAGDTKAVGGSVLATSSDVLVVGTSFTSNTTGAWTVRKSKSGTSWTTIDSFPGVTGVVAHPDAVTRDATQFYVVGGSNVVGSNTGPWQVRASTNGNSWTTVDSFDDPALPAAIAHAAVVDNSGHVFVGGPEAQSGDRTYHWVVRTTHDSGATWTIDDDQAPTLFTSGVEGLAFDELTGAIYAVGYDFDGYSYTWRVRARVSGVWSTVDEFLRDPTPTFSNQGSVPRTAAVSTVGNIFVSGYSRDAAGANHWTVRRSTNNGATWAIVDDIGGTATPAGRLVCAATASSFDATNKIVYVVGECHDGVSYHWVTRSSSDEGATWKTEDDFQLAPGVDSSPGGIDAAPNGGVFAAGMGRTAAGTPHWIVRQRACQ